MKTKSNGTKVQGTQVPRETPEVTAIVIREWIQRDIRTAITFLQAVLSEDAVLSEMTEIFEARMKQAQAQREAEGKL